MQIVKSDAIIYDLQWILFSNPFDAIVIVKQINNDYNVELLNEKAAEQFSQQNYRGINAQLFFSEAWDNIQSYMLQDDNCIQQITMSNGSNYVLKIEKIKLEEANYYVLFFRNADLQLVQHVDEYTKNKHLYFIEQFVEPILTVNLTGEIISLNEAAKNIIDNSVALNKTSIQSYISDQSMLQFNQMFELAKNGHFVNMVKINIESIFEDESEVSLTMIPTYWQGSIIGCHLILKSKNSKVVQFLSAHEDELTGLLNRRALNERWPNIIEHKNKDYIALILVDIDRFKRFNESLGKQKADQLLADICKRYTKLANENCEVFRYNGDECVFVVSHNEKQEVDDVANQIVQILKDPLIVEKQEYFVTASIGIATLPREYAELEKMLHKADQALFNVKANGRGHYLFYTKEMSQSFPNEALMEAHLKRAIEFDELSVYLQPQVNLQTNTIDSFEALMRWNNRKFGQVSPARFIPLAESSGLIHQLGDWILEEVIKYLHEWKNHHYRPVRIAVNISPKQFKQQGFASRVKMLLEKYNVDPSYLELEITESSMTNVKETTAILKELKEIGVYVSVDDFGTGYSSLSYLTTYPIDIIKIDQSFIADMKKGNKNEALVKAIINLSENLGLEVIAEGVEYEEQERFLLNNKCNKVQGYYYNKPMPIDQMVKKYLA